MASNDKSFDPRFDPAFQRGYDGPRVGLPPAARPPAPVASAAPVAPVFVEDAPVPALRGNPWVRALWVVGVVFVIGGVAGNAYAQASYTNGVFGSPSSDPFIRMVLPGIVQSISSWMTLVGFATLVAVLFLYAVRWRPAR